MGYYDPTYILVIIGAAIALFTSWNVKRAYSVNEKIRSMKNITAEQAAEMILKGAGITNVRIDRVAGDLTDHYSPKEKVLRLSDTVYDSTSIAAIGVAAHECGHAIQDKENYLPMTIRGLLIPAAEIGSTLSWPIILIGLAMGWLGLLKAGIVLFSTIVIFQLVTLPVEFDASGRALRVLRQTGILSEPELKRAKKVLIAAALTYVAALINSVLQLIRLILLSRRRDD